MTHQIGLEILLENLRLKLHGKVLRIPVGPARGLQWYCDMNYHIECGLGYYDYQLIQLILSLTKPGDVIYDIGSCNGFYALATARHLGPQGRVYAFEPLPVNQKIIAKQIKLNPQLPIELIKKAVTDRTKICVLQLGEKRTQGSLRRPLHVTGKVRCSGTSIDQFCRTQPPPQLVKIDIQGAAHLALKGMEKTVQRSQPCFLIELHGPPENSGVKRLLHRWKYSRLHLSPEHLIAWPHHKHSFHEIREILSKNAQLPFAQTRKIEMTLRRGLRTRN